jgi:hypothetical protein
MVLFLSNPFSTSSPSHLPIQPVPVNLYYHFGALMQIVNNTIPPRLVVPSHAIGVPVPLPSILVGIFGTSCSVWNAVLERQNSLKRQPFRVFLVSGTARPFQIRVFRNGNTERPFRPTRSVPDLGHLYPMHPAYCV